MSLSIKLKSAGIAWCIDPVEIDVPSRRYPDVVHKGERIRVRLTDGAAADPVTLTELFPAQYDSRDVEELLARAMRNQLPQHPAFLSWLAKMGHCPVTIRPDLLGDGLGECLHTALRKAVDGPQSVIQWNAICNLLPEDWSQLLAMTREEIEKARVVGAASKAKALTRYAVGLAIHEAFAERVGEVSVIERKRTDIQMLSLLMLEAACKLTDKQDFVWGWTAYLCEESKAPKAATEPLPNNSSAE